MRKALLAVALTSCTVVFAAPADDIKQLLETARDQDAYQLGRAQPGYLGDPLFDYYYGIAAINAGSPGEGVLAIERYRLHFPDNRSAQFHLARGYFTLGEDARALEEFQALAKTAQGTEVYTINRFLDAIRSRSSATRPTAAVWAEVGVGRDTNINSGVLSGQIAGLPDGLVVSSGQTSEKRADSFSTLAVGVQGNYPVRAGLTVYGGAIANTRTHANRANDVFDQTGWALYGGASRISGRHLFRLGIDLNTLNVYQQRYVSLLTLAGEWQYQADQFNRLGGMLQWSRQSFQNVNSYLDIEKTTPVASNADVRDANLTSLTGSWRRSLLMDASPVVTLSLNLGQEKNRKDRPDLSRNFVGLRLHATAQPRPNWTFGTGVGWNKSRFGAAFAEGLDTRQDLGLSVDASASYALSRHWALRMDYQHFGQRSNIGLYQFSRDALTLKLRYDTL